MKSFLELIDSFLNLFRPNRRALKATDGTAIEYVYDAPLYLIGRNELDGKDFKTTEISCEDPDGDFGEMSPTTPLTILNSHKEFSALVDPMSLSYHKFGLVALKKKRHKTKKATAEANTADILDILKWVDMLTATKLQQLSHIRRDRFLPLLKKLVKQGKIERIGGGKRGNPYFYRLFRK